MIKTRITVKRLMEFNPSIKTVKQAKKILKDIRTKPSISLNEMISNQQRGNK